jgi:hypothetical protein
MKVLEQGTTMILCPGEDCDMPLSYEDIKQISDEETFSRYMFQLASCILTKIR